MSNNLLYNNKSIGKYAIICIICTVRLFVIQVGNDFCFLLKVLPLHGFE